MSSFEGAPSEADRDLADCRLLADELFLRGIGSHTSIVYAPLNNDTNPFSQHFLRMAATRGPEHNSGSLEVVERYRSQDERVRMGYSVTDTSVAAFFDEDPFISPLQLDWPVVLYAPTIMDCMQNFKTPDEDKEIDPDALLTELTVVREPGRTTPHIQVHSAEGLDIAGYSLAITQVNHAMPRRLADTIRATYAVGETLAVAAEYQGRLALRVALQFDGQQRLVAIGGDKRNDMHEHIAALAGFKRAIFG